MTGDWMTMSVRSNFVCRKIASLLCTNTHSIPCIIRNGYHRLFPNRHLLMNCWQSPCDEAFFLEMGFDWISHPHIRFEASWGNLGSEQSIALTLKARKVISSIFMLLPSVSRRSSELSPDTPSSQLCVFSTWSLPQAKSSTRVL